MKRMIFKDDEWCQDCAEGWDGIESLGVALCPLHAAAPALLEALVGIVEIGKRCLTNEKYDGYFEAARAAIAQAKGASQ